MAQGDEARAGGLRRIAQRSSAVGRDDDVEPPGERRQQGGDVGLRPSGLGERDEQQDLRPADHLTAATLFWAYERRRTAERHGGLGRRPVRLVGDRGRRLRARRVVPRRAARAGGARGAASVPASYRQLLRPARWALAALAGFTAWSCCSIAWADARGEAWDGANRTLLYLTVFALFALVPWTAGEAAAVLAAFALATAAVGAAEIARALAGDAPAGFVDGRLAGADRLRERQRGAVPGRVLGGAAAGRAPATPWPRAASCSPPPGCWSSSRSSRRAAAR